MMIPVLMSLLIFGAISVAAYAVHLRVTADKSPVTARLRELRASRGTAGVAYGNRPPLFLKLLATIGGFMPASDSADALRSGLVRAGYRGHEAPLVFMGSKLLMAAAVPVMWSGVSYFTARPLGSAISWSLLLAVIGFYVPTWFIALRQRQRHDDIQSALPDSLDLMVVCVEAGLGMAAAIQRVGQEMALASRALSDELLLVNQEMQTGVSRTDALRNLAERSGVEDIYSLVAMLIQTDKLGTSVAQSLRSHAESMRTKRRQRAEQLARKASIKLAFPLVFLIFPALLVVILGPAGIQLMKALGAE
jgi:tight adherence protein C